MKKIFFLTFLLIFPFSIEALNLRGVSIEDENIELKENVYEYDVSIKNEIINPIIELDTDYDYEIKGNTDLNVGNNKIVITISDNNEKTDYILNVTRLSTDTIILSNNNYLSSLSVKGYSIGFDKNILEYNLSIENEKKLSIGYEIEGTYSNVYIDGNNNLKQGSVIKIKVVAQSGDVREYKLNIISASPNENIVDTNDNKVDIKAIIYVLSIVIISLFLVIINMKKS